MNWQPTQDGQRLTADGYEIRAEGRPSEHATNTERWYTAIDPSGREVASGYSTDGLAKCKRYCAENKNRQAQLENACASSSNGSVENSSDIDGATRKSSPVVADATASSPGERLHPAAEAAEPQASLF